MNHATLLGISDLHLHPFRPCSRNNGRDRANDGLAVFDQALRIATERGVDAVLEAGDLFHEKGRVDTITWNQAHDRFKNYERPQDRSTMDHMRACWRRGIGPDGAWPMRWDDVVPRIIAMPGNHDQGDRTGSDHAQRSLNEVAHVFNQPGAIDIETCTIGVVPWVEVDRCRDAFLSAAREACAEILRLEADIRANVASRRDVRLPRVLMGHTAVAGAITGSDYVFPGEEDPTVADLIALKAEFELDAIMLGHFHCHQVLAAGICFIGSPKQDTWGDSGQRRGCVIWDSRTPDVFEHIELDAPRFVRARLSDVEKALADNEYDEGDSHLAGDFVRIEAEETLSPSQQEKLRARLGARHLEVVPAAAEREEVEGDTVRERFEFSKLTIEERILRRVLKDHEKDEVAGDRRAALAIELYRENAQEAL
jgi:DNA repair exonuclease SbcCD nuclease subunit